MTEPLHVANGHCTTRLIEAAGLPGRTQIWADPLHDGPVPDLPDDELVAVRAEVVASGFDVAREAVAADLRQWRAAVDDHSSYHELITDSSFWMLVRGLAERQPALITVNASPDLSRPLPTGTLSLAR